MRYGMLIVTCLCMAVMPSLSLATEGPTTRPATPSAPAPASEAWRSDPACQMVFFAVLEGLYTDGVSDEVVNLIVPPQSKLDTNVKHSFVFRCPLCHAAYEAFVLYQRRQAFQGANEPSSTFGKGVDPEIIKRLKSEDIRTRVFAMGALVQPWIDRRVKAMKLGEEEKAALLKRLLDYAAAGDQLFSKYRGDPKSVYIEWQFYGGCQACQAARSVAQQMREAPRTTP